MDTTSHGNVTETARQFIYSKNPHIILMGEVLGLESAAKLFMENNDIAPGDIIGINRQDYCSVYYTKRGNFCVTFKRAYYRNFHKHFPGSCDVGITANQELIEKCIKNGLTFVAVMGDGNIFSIDPQKFLSYAYRHRRFVPHLRGEIAGPRRIFRRIA